MPFVRSADAVTHEIHGARFVAYANPASGSKELSAWRTEVPAGTDGVPHTVSREEVVQLLTGGLRLTVDGEEADLVAGDVAIVPAGATLRVDNVSGAEAAMWVATSVGLTAELADGTLLTPPWAG